MDPTVPLLNSTDTNSVFMNRIVSISNNLEEMIKTTYLNYNYLGNTYLDQYMLNMNQDITALIQATNSNVNTGDFLGTMNYGFNAVIIRYFELIRFLGVSYYNKSNSNYIDAPEFKEIGKIYMIIITR